MKYRFATIAAALLFCATSAHAADIKGRATEIPDAVWKDMQGKSWHTNLPCPPRKDLRYLVVPFRGFNGKTQLGELIVAKSQAEKIVAAFDEIYASDKFRIEKMKLVDVYGGSDDASTGDNNTSAFNCRTVAKSKVLSSHARGTAIDINPVQNPYVIFKSGKPTKKDPFDEDAERKDSVVGLITPGSIVDKAFAKQGWKWGGYWKSKKDFQHFSADGK